MLKMKTSNKRGALADRLPNLPGFSLAIKLCAALLVMVMALFILMPGNAWALTLVSNFGSNPGNLRMYQYVPPDLPSNAPLVVALHGCTQSASTYDDETGWVKLADDYKFALVLPEQKSVNNFNECFNWFEPGDIERGQGEALSLKQMVDKMKADYNIDSSRVFTTGLSAGGFMSNVLLATYPDVFAGGAPIAGGPYKCGIGLAAFTCMNPGVDKDPPEWGDLVRNASSHSGPWPIVSVWHGDADYTVRGSNLTEKMEEWTDVHGVDQNPEKVEETENYIHKVYEDSSGKALVETWVIKGMGHGTPIDPGTDKKQCGVAGPYILDEDICSSYYIAKFWGLTDGSSFKIISPADGASVSDTVSIEVSASDQVSRVEFSVDGTLDKTDHRSPYAVSWEPSMENQGDHTLEATAYDAAGSEIASDSISVTVGGDGSPIGATFSNDDSQDGYVKANPDGSSAAVGSYEGWLGIAVGRGSDGKFNRAVLSFDTSSIPDDAAITKAYLTMESRSASGDPWGDPTGNELVVDVKDGCFGNCFIESGDWSAGATASEVAKVAKFSSGSQNSSDFNNVGLEAINKTGITQVKLRFSQDQTSTNYIGLDKGAAAKLHVEYGESQLVKLTPQKMLTP